MPPSDPFASAVVVAAGKGERFGAIDKVLITLAGQPVLAWTLEALEASETVADVVVVAGEHTLPAISALIDRGNWTKARTVIVGGARRQDSVLAGLWATEEREIVLIHDAARPLATAEQFDACALAARDSGGAIIARPVSDTLKRVRDDGRIEATVPRDHLWAAQTPQGFRRRLLLDAFASPQGQSGSFTDEASLLETLGYAVRVVQFGGLNLKLTLPEDLPVVEALLRARLARIRP